jgi:hypothetical protein
LEPFKEYEFNTVLEIHENILLMLNAIIGYLEGKEHELTFHIVKKNIGLNIDNFISSFSFDITVIKEKINLFITYIEFFHKLHTKQLQRFSNKIQLMYSHVNKDIRFDESIDINDKKKKSNSFEKIENSSIIYNIDNSSDTDDSNSLNSPFSNNNTNQNFTSNPLLIITNSNNYNTDDETTNQNQLNEAFSNIENKCDLILNSNISSDVPGVTIEQINEYVNVIAPIQEQENISIVINDEELSLQKENNNENNLETQFFAFKPLE